jgi:hypothetical protein
VGGSLLADEDFRATTFHVIDFEATTPRGYRPERIEVAVISLSLSGAGLAETARFTELMCPPGHAPIGPLDTSQTGTRRPINCRRLPLGRRPDRRGIP